MSDTTRDIMNGVLEGNRAVLAQAITLIESQAPAHQKQAQDLLGRLLSHAGKSVRIGITGVPGVGKSTFIDAFGSLLCSQGHHVAVLTVDPSSAISGGSILGDKVRMARLANEPNAFIRPSPSSENLGGVAHRTRETMLLCEAAGFDIILVETVGVGQSEIAVRSMVDFFLLMLLPESGDELQGMKKGIVEMVDAIFVNKADGDNISRAQRTQAEYATVMKYAKPATPQWKPDVYLGSAKQGDGIDRMWKLITQFMSDLKPAGVIQKRRQQQTVDWLHDLINQELKARFYSRPEIAASLSQLESDVLDGKKTVVDTARELVDQFTQKGVQLDSKD